MTTTSRVLDTSDLFPWIEEICDGTITQAKLASGGNRCQGWMVDVEDRMGRMRPLFLRYQAFEEGSGGAYTIRREAEIYDALSATDVRIPRLIGVHPEHQAMLTERADGTAAYLRLTDPVEKGAIARDFVEALACLHAVPAAGLKLPSLGGHATIREAVEAELAIWSDMYRATGREDALIEFGHAWLTDNMPDIGAPAVIVHGDAGPGNFMFDKGRMTRLIDWELAHLGDLMEDLAWFSMRSMLEPVPDFPARIREYAAAAGTPVAVDRILFHRVFVSWRVTIIRHANASGEAGGSIISRALNRRLLVEAIAAVEGAAMPVFEPVVPSRERDTSIHDRVLEGIRDIIVPRSTDSQVIHKAKDYAKAVKYMRQLYRIGEDVERRECAALSELLGSEPASIEAGRAALSAAIRARVITPRQALAFFQLSTDLDTQLARDTMGALATRHFPPLTDDQI